MTVALLAVLFGAPAAGQVAEEKVIAGLSQTHVSITTDFSGSEIFIYGAIKRESPAPEGWPLDVIVAVTGPLEPVIVRKKERRLGIWVNDAGVKVDAAPSLYAVATTGPFRDIISFTDDFRYKVGIENLVHYIGETDDVEFKEGYPEALVRLRRAQGIYFELTDGVKVIDETLFETRIRLPANVTRLSGRSRPASCRRSISSDAALRNRSAGAPRSICRASSPEAPA